MLCEHIAGNSVELIRLEPPFASNAFCTVPFKAPDGAQSSAWIGAFDDTLHRDDSAEAAFRQVLRSGNANAAQTLRAMRSLLGENDMMAVRLTDLH